MKNHEEFKNFLKNEIIDIPNNLNEELTEENNRFNYRYNVEDIFNLIEEFINNENSERYMVLPGLRGVGKTTILYQVYEFLFKEKNINTKNILYLSAERLKTVFDISIFDALTIFLEVFHNNSTLRNLDEKIFLLIDEAQYDTDLALSGKIIFDSSKNIFMIFTGSSALDLEYNADSARRLLKMPINPLNYSEHLKLKYNFESKDMSKELVNLILNGNTDKIIHLENKLNDDLLSLKDYKLNDWDEYLKYGGFPFSFHMNNYRTSKKLLDMINRIITIDMKNINDISSKTQTYTSRILHLFALQKPGDISQNKIANYLECSSSLVKNILDLLEKTHLIFHYEPYSSSAKRVRASWEYYFATPSLRHALALNMGIPSRDSKEYGDILLENLIASLLFNIKNLNNQYFNIFFDSKKGGVDFLVQKGFNNPIPIEVGIGKKTKKQVMNAITNYNSDYGIIVSNATDSIEIDENIIFVPVKTFSFL